MGITTVGLNVFAANLTGSALLTHIGIGDGKTAYVSGNTALVNETDRNLITTTDLTTAKKVTLITNHSPPEISGLFLSEFGAFTTGSTMANREVLAGSVQFTGENELQIQQTYEFFISGS